MRRALRSVLPSPRRRESPEDRLAIRALTEITRRRSRASIGRFLVPGKKKSRVIPFADTLSGEQRDVDAAKFYESMGGYAPTIGIIGAVVGLIHVMGNLADPANVGPGIAVAFVATIYGVALANLFFLPIAAKLRSCVREAAQYREMIIEGIIAIADGENPRAIELRLNGYLE